ncbi:MAG: asparagine synthase (glutamine-hydrolyzing) [Syntrophomonas sp.]
MCGIAGWIDFNKDLSRQNEVINTMANTLNHRGPDAAGAFLSEHAALGHRRLIVVDPEGGGQPMTRTHKGNEFTIIYNGELYNTAEIRQVLKTRGYSFKTRNSDTEVLLTAYMEWGAECLQHLNGIFAFAIWDKNAQQLFMARDRLGVKPLFYTLKGGSLWFASELKALLVHPQIKAQVDAGGLAEIFIMGPARTPGEGVFKGITELRPGRYLIFNRDGIKVKKYWELNSQNHTEDLDTTAVHLRELLQDTVSRQLSADVPVCTLLSGGLDSSAISALAALALEGGSNLKTFSVDYIDNDKFFLPNSFETTADYPWVKRVADHIGSDHSYILIDNRELAEALESSLHANDLPGMTDIDSSLYLFCREIRKQVVVGLSGECADEVFGGYPWFRQLPSNTEYFPWIRMVKQRTEFLAPWLTNRISPEEYLQERFQQAISEVPGLDGEDETEARIRQLFYFNITRFMPTLLDRKDRMSMAWGLEVRVPFSDHRLVEYVWNIPWKIKNCDGMAKGILRRALRGLLPDDVLYRPKSPYPKTHNPQYANAVRERFLKMLNTSTSPLLPLMEIKEIKAIAASGKTYFENPWFGQLMGDTQYMAYLLLVNRWLEKYQVEIVL